MNDERKKIVAEIVGDDFVSEHLDAIEMISILTDFENGLVSRDIIVKKWFELSKKLTAKQKDAICSSVFDMTTIDAREHQLYKAILFDIDRQTWIKGILLNTTGKDAGDYAFIKRYDERIESLEIDLIGIVKNMNEIALNGAKSGARLCYLYEFYNKKGNKFLGQINFRDGIVASKHVYEFPPETKE